VAWLLQAVPGARLMILTVPEGRARAQLVRAFAEQGIAEERLTLRGRLPFHEFLASHSEVDIALDPFPFAGTTTTCQTLWMGVPVVTLAGASHAGRVGLSLLTEHGAGTAGRARPAGVRLRLRRRCHGILSALAELRAACVRA
jgi:predicted O-linked N-acetylglucosamine transferase (SPINDLY family)